MKLIRKILFPVVPVYYSVTWLRNKLFDVGLKKSISYDFPIICVGNLSTGGTGKTPMIEYLIDVLKDNYCVATLSRGYKRKSKGFQIGNNKVTVDVLGDEPFQFYNKFKKDVLVAVDADRNNGITRLRTLENSPEIVLLDDAFQHRKVKAGFNIMLSTYSNLYTDDIVLPTGNLREPRSGAKRAHAIVVTKCPFNITDADKKSLVTKINPTENQNVFFSSIQYSDAVENENSSLNLDGLSKFTLITGIANSKPLVDFLNEKRLKFEHLNFNDHYEFTEQDIQNFEEQTLLITTEKDFMRLKQYESLKQKLFYLPIKVSIDNELKFNTLIDSFVKSF
ncbi:MAG: tetraacyldisaccharide 4'-kinase [Algibacter sp.]